MKLKKLKINQIADTTLNEREMLRLFGTGTPGCCQCGCHYAGQPGGSSSSANANANYKHGYVSDPGAQPCCAPCDGYSEPPWPEPPPIEIPPLPQSSICPGGAGCWIQQCNWL